MKSRALWICIIVLVCAGGGYFYFRNGSSEPVTYQKQAVERGDVVVSISATGTLSAVTTVQVGSQVSGTIAKLNADFNSEVKEGQLLAQLDPTFLQATVSEQTANVERAEAQLNEAKRNFNRMNELHVKAMVSQAEVDASTTALETAEASMKQAEASLQRAKVNLRYATILAPIDGVVISRNVDVGQTVAASLQAPTLFTIANDLRKMQVQASIDEADIGSVRKGQHVSFRVDAYPEEQFTGELSQIRLAPIVTQNVVTYSVIIDVDNAELKLMPGMTATVSIEVDKREDVLRVPLQAIQFAPSAVGKESTGGERDQGTGVRVADSSGAKTKPRRSPDSVRLWTMENDQLKPVPARKGIQNTRWVELVESTLQEGDSIVVSQTGGMMSQSSPQGTNPFMPQMPGRGGRTRGF